MLYEDEIKHCPFCGAEFKPRNGAQIYCSKTCNRLARRQREHNPLPPVRICKVCGKEFAPAAHNHFICSDECREVANNERQKQRYAEIRARMAEKKVCPICGIEFETDNGHRRYCSPECAAESERRKNKERVVRFNSKKHGVSAIRNCAVCGKEFESVNGRVCCSDECTAENKRRKKREYAARLYQARLESRETGKCPICGKEFIKLRGRHVYCSTACYLEAQARQKAERRAASEESRKRRDALLAAGVPPGMKPCKRCGKLFPHNGKALQFCEECRAVRDKEQWQAWAERQRQLAAELTPKPSRRCHDCGKPTWDYRCPDCLKKWRAKNRVPENYANLSDEEDAHVWI